MIIAIMADDKKKEIMAQFCIAYCGILSRHHLCATSSTANYISEATGLKFEKLLSGSIGGLEQIESRIQYDEIDMLLFMRDYDPLEGDLMLAENNLLRLCDVHNVPVATNMATAEILVMALDRGDLDYRDFINPVSDYNLNKKKNNKK